MVDRNGDPNVPQAQRQRRRRGCERGYRNYLRCRGRLSIPRSTAYDINRRLRLAAAAIENNARLPGAHDVPVRPQPEPQNLNEDHGNEEMEDDASSSEEEADENQDQNDGAVFAEDLIREEAGNGDVPDEGMPELTVGPKDLEADDFLKDAAAPNIRCTRFEALLMILNFSVRHGLTGVAVEDLCKLLNVLLGRNTIPSSRYIFKKTFGTDMPLQYHMYCINCDFYIGLITNAMRQQKTVQCGSCHKLCKVPGLNGKNFFVTLPVKTQIADLLQTMEDVLDHLNHRWERDPGENIEDVFDGEVYKNLCEEGKFLSHRFNLSLTFNTDGANVFESGCTTMWPIFFRLNELKPEKRYDESYKMLAALWFGESKPPMAMYFRLFLHECRDLYNNGITWKAPNDQIIHSKVITLNCVLDSVAKPLLQSITQYNGFFSCPYCMHPGVTFGENVMCKWPVGDNLALTSELTFLYTIKKYDRNSDELVSHHVGDRNNELVRRDMEIAQQRKGVEPNFKNFRGLKGKSPMCFLPFFDVCYGFQIDYLHSVLLGTCKHVAALWFDSCNSEEAYSIRDSISEIDERLVALTPPTSISRRPRPISQKSDWHANEWRSWLLYYSLPCLRDILPSRYYKHHCILVSSIFILLKDSISRSDLEETTWALGQYVYEFQTLYSHDDMFFNVHLLLHLGKSVKMWGPLFCYSMFSFESANNSLVKLVKGTTGVASQIVSKYCVSKFLVHVMEVYNVSEEVLSYCSDLICYQKFSHTSKQGAITLIGSQKFIELTDEERQILHAHAIPECGNFYERMIKTHILYHARLYSRRGARSDDSIIRLGDGSYAAIQRIILRVDRQAVLLVRCINVERGYITFHQNSGSKAKHIKLCRPIVYGNLALVNASDVVGKSIILKCDRYTYIADFPNTIEKD